MSWARRDQDRFDVDREVGADESPEAFEETFAKVVPPKAGKPPAKGGKASRKPTSK